MNKLFFESITCKPALQPASQPLIFFITLYIKYWSHTLFLFCLLQLSTLPAPQPIVTVNATAIRLPALSPYNDVILACNAALPVSPAALTASLVFTWLMGTQDVTGSSTTSSSTTSTLTRVETTPSVFNYTCRFTVNVAGDPPYQSEANTNIVVTGR